MPGKPLDPRAEGSIRPVIASGAGGGGREPGGLETRKSAITAWLELEPKSASGHERLAKAIFHLKEFDAAYEELGRAVQLDASIAPPAITMAWLFTRAGNIKKAEEWIAFANKTGEENLAVQMETAAWLMEQGRADVAQSHVDAAAKLKPGRSRSSGYSGFWRASVRILRKRSRFSTSCRMKLPARRGCATSSRSAWSSNATRPRASGPSSWPNSA